MNHLRANRYVADGDYPAAAEPLEGAFSRHQDELLGMLYYLVGNLEDARDAYQETFLKCWRHRHEVPEIVNLRAWIFKIAVNAARDLRSTAWRRRRRALDEGDAILLAEGNNRTGSDSEKHSPAAEAIRREQLALVRAALLQLRPEEREVFLLRQNGDMTYDQIALSIDIPVGTVKTRMRLALTKLSVALQANPQ